MATVGQPPAPSALDQARSPQRLGLESVEMAGARGKSCQIIRRAEKVSPSNVPRGLIQTKAWNTARNGAIRFNVGREIYVHNFGPRPRGYSGGDSFRCRTVGLQSRHAVRSYQ